jgi:signal transduction histidine kinase
MNLRIKLATVTGGILFLLTIGLYLNFLLLSPSKDTPTVSHSERSLRINVEPLAATPHKRVTITDSQGTILAALNTDAVTPQHALLSVAIPNSQTSVAAPSKLQLVLWAALLVAGLSTLMAFFNRSLLNPIQRVTTFITTISAANNLSLRVPSTGSQAVAGLEDSVNSILDTTEFSYLNMMTARYEAESANRGTSLFVAKVSHELRTPIHGITGMLRILLKQEQSEGKRHYIQMAQDAANALLNTINEILDFSKMQSKRSSN